LPGRWEAILAVVSVDHQSREASRSVSEMSHVLTDYIQKSIDALARSTARLMPTGGTLSTLAIAAIDGDKGPIKLNFRSIWH